MIKKLSLCALFFALCASASFAQQIVTDDYHKFEVFGGYSNNQVDTGAFNQIDNVPQNAFDDRESFNGFNASAVGNFSRYVGAKGEISGHYKTFNFNVPITTTINQNVKVKASLYNFMGGVQVKDNNREGSRVRPFGHAMIGVARVTTKIDDALLTPFLGTDASVTGYGLAAALGGGLDIKATDRVSIRAIQIDYNPTRLTGSINHNFRFGVGVVFH